MNHDLLISAEMSDGMTDRGGGSAPRVLLSVEEAAEQLSLSRTRLYALLKTGDIASVRVGRLRRVPVDALLQFIARLVREQSTDHGEVA
jgi:excisionase family DNA binding protein